MKTYFDHDLLHRQIVAALVLAPHPLNVAMLLRVCSAAPDTQAVSDSLRRLKRQGLAVLLAQEKRWIPGPAAGNLAREELAHVDLRLLRSTSGRRKISQADLERETLLFLQKKVQEGQNATHFTEILSYFRDRQVDRHRLSQVLYILKKKDLVGSPEKSTEDSGDVMVRFYYPRPPKKTQTLSLFDDLDLDSSHGLLSHPEDRTLSQEEDLIEDPSLVPHTSEKTSEKAPRKSQPVSWRLKLRQNELKRAIQLQQMKRSS